MAKNILLCNKTPRVLILTGIRDTAGKPVTLSGEGTAGARVECSDDVLEHADVAKFLSVGWLMVEGLEPMEPAVLEVTVSDHVAVAVTPSVEEAAAPAETAPVEDAPAAEAPPQDEPPVRRGRRGR